MVTTPKTPEEVKSTWTGKTTTVDRLPPEIRQYYQKRVQRVKCRNEERHKEWFHTYLLEARDTVCTWCNPTIANSRGKVIRSWLWDDEKIQHTARKAFDYIRQHPEPADLPIPEWEEE